MVMHHFIVQNYVGVILKSLGPMLEFGHGKQRSTLDGQWISYTVELYTQLNTAFDNFRDNNML